MTDLDLDLLTLAEVAKMTRTPEASLRWRRSRGLPPRSLKLGRRVLYHRADVLAWVAAAGEATDSLCR